MQRTNISNVLELDVPIALAIPRTAIVVSSMLQHVALQIDNKAKYLCVILNVKENESKF